MAISMTYSRLSLSSSPFSSDGEIRLYSRWLWFFITRDSLVISPVHSLCPLLFWRRIWAFSIRRLGFFPRYYYSQPPSFSWRATIFVLFLKYSRNNVFHFPPGENVSLTLPGMPFFRRDRLPVVRSPGLPPSMEGLSGSPSHLQWMGQEFCHENWSQAYPSAIFPSEGESEHEVMDMEFPGYLLFCLIPWLFPIPFSLPSTLLSEENLRRWLTHNVISDHMHWFFMVI